MRKTIEVNGTYLLCYAYDCDTSTSYYDIYDKEENWLGEIPSSYVEDNLIDEETEEYDEDGLETLIEDILTLMDEVVTDKADTQEEIGNALLARWHNCDKTDAKSLYDLVCDMADFITDTIYNE